VFLSEVKRHDRLANSKKTVIFPELLAQANYDSLNETAC